MKIAAIAIATLSMLLVSASPQQGEPKGKWDPVIYCGEIHELRMMSTFQKDAQMAAAVLEKTPRKEAIIRTAIFLAMEELLKELDRLDKECLVN